MNNKRNLLIMIITLSLVLILGSSYAYLMYTKESTNNYVINVGTLEVTFEDSKTQFLNLSNMYPMTDEEGESLEQELVFQVKNTGNLVANYNVYIEELSTDPEFKTVIKYIVNKDNKGYSEPKILSEDKYIESEGKLKVGETSEYHVKVWLMETADNTYMNKEFKAKVVVEGNQNLDKTMPLKDTLIEAIASHTTDTCTPTLTDDNGTPSDPSDDIIYFSGDNECVNFNYVWYSGKLWRIVAINSDGSMKLITQDEITAISWGEDTIYKNKDKDNYKASWIYQWLNEDFKDTLYNYENIIVKDASWNATETTSYTTKIPETTMVTGDVGLLNAYEQYQSYKNTISSRGYLKNGYNWWLITPVSSNVWYVSEYGNLSNNNPFSGAKGVRPSINLKSNIGIVAGGDGSETNPYRINDDKESGNNGDLINTRLSGEYVEVDNKIYRIVGIDKDDEGNNITKLTSVDYVRDGDTVLTKNFSSSNSIRNYGTVVSNGNVWHWGYYLNNTWLTTELQKYITDGTYYLGQVGEVTSFKNSICRASNTTEPASSCEKTTTTWRGLVGLPRMGEMFSAMLGKGYNDTLADIWLITPYSGSNMSFVFNNGSLGSTGPSSDQHGTRPSIYLKPEVKITGGDGMSPESAYTIGLPSENNKKN